MKAPAFLGVAGLLGCSAAAPPPAASMGDAPPTPPAPTQPAAITAGSAEKPPTDPAAPPAAASAPGAAANAVPVDAPADDGAGEKAKAAPGTPAAPRPSVPTVERSAPPTKGDAPTSEPAPPALHGPDGALLPQTEERPTVDEPIFRHRMNLLFEAIVQDDPELARPFFFPVEAYEKVKAIVDPRRDWNRRLWKLFVRDVHDYHRELGDEPREARLDQFELRERDVQWVKPHREGNAIGYWRVRRSKLHVTTAAGESKRLDLTAMISWRGHWHVVHLNGFK